MARVDTKNRTKYWWDQHVSGLSLMCADFTTHEYATHTHDALVIAVTELGGAHIKCRGVIEPVSPSRLFLSNPEEPQSSRMGESRRWRYRSMYLTRAALDIVARGLGVESAPNFTANFLTDTDLSTRFAWLHRVLEATGDRFLEHELLIGAFAQLFSSYGSGGDRIEKTPSAPAVVRKITDVMQARFAEGLLLDDLATAANLTVFQLIGLFKRTLGVTPHAYLVHVRLNAACRQLRLGRPIADAAVAVGFCDQSALTKYFKRCYGITPLQFAKAAAVTRRGSEGMQEGGRG
jgi:AraC-like DNA-binding protein